MAVLERAGRPAGGTRTRGRGHEEVIDDGQPSPSRHAQWLDRVNARRARSDELFVEHFRDKYDGRMPVWALTELLELGHLSVLYRGMNQLDAEEIAAAFGVPTKTRAHLALARASL
ncbi:Abi family protein [Microbacterium sp. X-17]|uniref:Abi family protein n=1 Tax=Microbacterium sp. X-17 TaxID=3144404 RepID=UPI0031F5A897